MGLLQGTPNRMRPDDLCGWFYDFESYYLKSRIESWALVKLRISGLCRDHVRSFLKRLLGCIGGVWTRFLCRILAEASSAAWTIARGPRKSKRWSSKVLIREIFLKAHRQSSFDSRHTSSLLKDFWKIWGRVGLHARSNMHIEKVGGRPVDAFPVSASACGAPCAPSGFRLSGLRVEGPSG